MKLKLASLGLLALTPLAAQAELVEMQDNALAEVSGQAFSWSGNVNAGWTGTVAGYDVSNTASVFHPHSDHLEVEVANQVSNPGSGAWVRKSFAYDNFHGTKTVIPSFSWYRP